MVTTGPSHLSLLEKVQQCNLIVLPKLNLIIPSEMEVTPRIYAVFTVGTVDTVETVAVPKTELD